MAKVRGRIREEKLTLGNGNAVIKVGNALYPQGSVVFDISRTSNDCFGEKYDICL
jgi:hypothetical protein